MCELLPARRVLKDPKRVLLTPTSQAQTISRRDVYTIENATHASSRISGKSNYRSKTFMETELVLSEAPKRKRIRIRIRTAKSKLFIAQTSEVLKFKAIIVE